MPRNAHRAKRPEKKRRGPVPLDDAREAHFVGVAGGSNDTVDIEGFGRLNTCSLAVRDHLDATTSLRDAVSAQPRSTVPACPPILEPADVCRQEVHWRRCWTVSDAKKRAVADFRAEIVDGMNGCNHHALCHRYARLRLGRAADTTHPLSLASHREQPYLASAIKMVRPLRPPAALLGTPDQAVGTGLLNPATTTIRCCASRRPLVLKTTSYRERESGAPRIQGPEPGV